MANHRHLTRAPIREAVIDIQFSPPVALDTVKLMTERIKNEFPKSDEIWQASVGFRLGVDGNNDETSTEKNVIGIRYDTNEYILQCQVDRFTFSRLAPYESWEKMSGVARRLWQEFISVTSPGTVTRIATRYINALPLPLPITDFGDYLAMPPVIPEALPQSLSSFLQRVVIVDAANESVAAVTQVFEGTPTTHATVILDIDAFKNCDKGMDPNSDDIWAKLDGLRSFKNRVFFEYLTEKTIGLFE